MNYKSQMRLRNVSRQHCPVFEMSLTPKIKFRDGRRETRLQLYEIQGATQEACGEWKKSRYNHDCKQNEVSTLKGDRTTRRWLSSLTPPLRRYSIVFLMWCETNIWNIVCIIPVMS